MTAFRALSVLVVAGASALATGCSSGSVAQPESPSQGGQGASDDGGSSASFGGGSTAPTSEAGTFGPYDAGSMGPFEGGAPVDDDAGSWSDDGGWPGLPADGGSLSLDGGVAMCNPLDPKYAQEYLKEATSGLPTPCTACTASECCYSLIACVPK